MTPAINGFRDVFRCVQQNIHGCCVNRPPRLAGMCACVNACVLVWAGHCRCSIITGRARVPFRLTFLPTFAAFSTFQNNGSHHESQFSGSRDRERQRRRKRAVTRLNSPPCGLLVGEKKAAFMQATSPYFPTTIAYDKLS